MYVFKEIVTVDADASGDGIGYSSVVRGQILQIRYVKDDFANGVDFDVTLEDSGVVVWDEDNVNASKTVLPRQGVHDTVGVAATLDGTRLMREPIYVDGERIKFLVAQAGVSTSGVFHVWMR
jgi:hypothetical protein